MELNIKDLKELLETSQAADSKGINDFAIGQEVIVRTYSAGVWFGLLKQKSRQ